MKKSTEFYSNQLREAMKQPGWPHTLLEYSSGLTSYLGRLVMALRPHKHPVELLPGYNFPVFVPKEKEDGLLFPMENREHPEILAFAERTGSTNRVETHVYPGTEPHSLLVEVCFFDKGPGYPTIELRAGIDLKGVRWIEEIVGRKRPAAEPPKPKRQHKNGGRNGKYKNSPPMQHSRWFVTT